MTSPFQHHTTFQSEKHKNLAKLQQRKTELKAYGIRFGALLFILPTVWSFREFSFSHMGMVFCQRFLISTSYPYRPFVIDGSGLVSHFPFLLWSPFVRHYWHAHSHYLGRVSFPSHLIPRARDALYTTFPLLHIPDLPCTSSRWIWRSFSFVYILLTLPLYIDQPYPVYCCHSFSLHLHCYNPLPACPLFTLLYNLHFLTLAGIQPFIYFCNIALSGHDQILTYYLGAYMHFKLLTLYSL